MPDEHETTVPETSLGAEIAALQEMTRDADPQDFKRLVEIAGEADRLLILAKAAAKAEPDAEAAVFRWLTDKASIIAAAPELYTWCGCTGPRNEEPLCPCGMKYDVLHHGGRVLRLEAAPDAILVHDLGPEGGWKPAPRREPTQALFTLNPLARFLLRTATLEDTSCETGGGRP